MDKSLAINFWDVDVNKLDLDKQNDFVIARILEHGHLSHIKWLLKKYPESKIKKVIRQSRNLSEKTAIFWANYFNIPKDKILCLKKSYLQKRKMFWPH